VHIYRYTLFIHQYTTNKAENCINLCLHFLGYSQGGLIARGMIEEYGTEHNVRTFVSLSSPQGGQYGGGSFYIIIY